MSEFPGDCFRCREPGHIAAECPELIPASSKAEHEARIARYVQRWWDGDMSAWQKQQAIRTENEMWNRRNS